MATYWRSPIILSLIVLGSLILFFPFLSTFFSADDFYNMRLVMEDPIGKVIGSFLFVRNPIFLFYRPLTTQLFFFLGKELFAFNPLGYHLISFSLFVLSLVIVYRLGTSIAQNKDTGLLTAFFYAFSASNFTRLAWISQIQEVTLAACVLLGSHFFIRYLLEKKTKYWIWTFVFFLISLTAKESAIIFPFYLCILTIFYCYIGKIKGKIILTLWPFLLSLITYGYFRFFSIGVSTGENYFTSFALKNILNTALWYTLWSLSLPEQLANFDFFGKNFQPNGEMLHGLASTMPGVMLFFMFLTFFIICLFLAALKTLQSYSSQQRVKVIVMFLLGTSWYILALVPHLFSPWHKFSYELGVPLFGISLIMALLVGLAGQSLWTKTKPFSIGSVIIGIFLLVHIVLSYQTVRVERQTHWVFLRSTISQAIFSYLHKYYPWLPPGTTVAFVNDKIATNPQYGLSKQISLALAKESALQLLYGDPTIRVLYEDEGKISLQPGERIVILPSSPFIQ